MQKDAHFIAYKFTVLEGDQLIFKHLKHLNNISLKAKIYFEFKFNEHSTTLLHLKACYTHDTLALAGAVSPID